MSIWFLRIPGITKHHVTKHQVVLDHKVLNRLPVPRTGLRHHPANGRLTLQAIGTRPRLVSIVILAAPYIVSPYLPADEDELVNLL